MKVGIGWAVVLALLASGCGGPAADNGKSGPTGSGPSGGPDKAKAVTKAADKSDCPAGKPNPAPPQEPGKSSPAAAVSGVSQVPRVFASEEHGSKVECLAFSPDGK